MRKMILSFVVVTAAALIVPAAARAQNPPRTPQQRDLQYQIATLESVLARAVEHGALEIRDRLQAIVPAQMLLSDNARVRGFPLPGYGIVFDVAVPGLDGTLPWSFQTMDQNNLGLESALSALRGAVQKMNDANLDQAMKRIELQVSPVSAAIDQTGARPAPGDARFVQGTAAAAALVDEPAARSAQVAVVPAPRAAVDAVMRNPDEAYRQTITVHIKDAMLNHSIGLNLAPNEMLTVVAKSNEDMLLGASAPDSRVTTITVTSEDLAAFRSGQITREEAHRRIAVSVF
jgi:hypothetical protein